MALTMTALNQHSPKANYHQVQRHQQYHYHRKVFDGQYQIEERLNAGAKGVVYKVTDRHSKHASTAAAVGKENNGVYAAKRIPRQGLREQDEKDILSEINILKSLRNVPHVVKFVDYYIEADSFYIVQELAKGGDVFERIDREELYNEHAARSVAIKLLQTIQKLHQRGIVHRDIKPENILLADARDGTSVLLADFGFATYVPREGLTRRCGTPCFCAPEVWQRRPYHKAVDLWATGCVLYMMMSGYPPFYAADNHDIFRLACQGYVSFHAPVWNTISMEAKEFILGLLRVDPLQRWTVEEALQSTWIQSGLTDALFDNLDWMPKCSQRSDSGRCYAYTIEPMPLQLG